MQLTERIKEEFTAEDRKRGDSYFEKDRVRIVDESPTYMAAMVCGSHGTQYFVQVDVGCSEAGLVSASCECPRFDDGYPCKHIWATLCCLDENGPPAGSSPLQLIAESADQLNAATARRRNAKPNYETVIAGRKNPNLPTSWRAQIRDLAQSVTAVSSTTPSLRPSNSDQQYWYVISIADQGVADEIGIDLYISNRKKSGGWGKPLRRRIEKDEISAVDDPIDRRILQLISRDEPSYGYHRLMELKLNSDFISDVVPLLCDTGRFVWCLSADRALEEHHSIAWDPGEPWQARLRLTRQSTSPGNGKPHTSPTSDESSPPSLELTAELVRPDQVLPVRDVVFASAQGLLLTQTHAARLNPFDASLLNGLMRHGRITAEAEDLDGLLAGLAEIPFLPKIEFGEGLDVTCDLGEPEPMLEVTEDDMEGGRTLLANVYFKYGDIDVRQDCQQSCLWDAKQRRMLRRDSHRERELLAMLIDVPLRPSNLYYHDPHQLILHIDDLHQVALALSEQGWNVVAHGRKMRRAGSFDIQVASGTDWFDVTANLEFDGRSAGLPELLRAIRQKRKYIVLDDGSHGLLPEEWLKQYQRFANIAQQHDDVMRFSMSQALLLDAMLAEQDSVTVDTNYSKTIRKLQQFDGIAAGKQPAAFCGELRDYQRDGLGWFQFLREFGFGGCLADDMGLGKTVQVLAMLQSRRSRRLKPDESRRPSIVVVPRSLVFNWMEEAERFTPKLNVVDYTGLDRGDLWNELTAADVVVTTYGTLRRDIARLRELRFDYAILDESQAVKNSKSQASKACRLLDADHRLAMTGTPIENHLGELWTLLEFLNPGMLGSESAFRKLSAKSDVESLQWLNHSLRPFVLRRTKSQVLTELPAKTEQTLYCEMEPQQKKRYDELRDYYRSHIGNKVKEIGVNRAKIHVLEALLRLRQAACDPRLLDDTHQEPGAKIEQLMIQLEEVLDEGHKALVFSQFTSMLALVRSAVEQRQWDYEYLDGKTRKRGECVRRFQQDDGCQLFLISLKAGGHGLNLTAADYVFILDPWWNPAVEAQAIDRAHRIGQTRPVMAYRFICRDTVEDKIIQLQQSKRELADAIITANESLITTLSLDDLQLLFG